MADTPRAGIYCRISRSDLEDTTKVEDQERISRDLATRLGWDVAEVYVDNNRSAWKKNRKREAWDAMLTAIGEGRLDAIIVYHGDRLIRQPWDLEQLLNLADTKGIRLASPTGVRNLDDSQDRIMLRVLTAFACGSSDDTSRRKKDGFERMRRQGLVRSGGRGGRPFGFATDMVTHIPAEVAIIREAAARILSGESTGAIARDLSARGVRTPARNPFIHQTLTKMLARPRYAGLMPDGVSKAAWEPVLDRQTWEEVRAQLAVRALVVPAPSNARKWLLSGIAECGACGKPLQINAAHRQRNSEGPAYRCVQPGCRKVHRAAGFLDAYVTARTVNRLGDPAVAQARLPETPGLAAELMTLTERRAEAEQVIASYADRPERLAVLARALDSIDDRIAAVRDRIGAGSERRVLGAHAGITLEEFAILPLDVRRTLISACYRVTVFPASARGPGFRTQDVRLALRE